MSQYLSEPRTMSATGVRRASLLIVAALVTCMVTGSSVSPNSLAQDAPPAKEQAAPQRPTSAYLVPVPMPITGTVDTHVKQRVDQILGELPRGESRPVLILEFRTRSDQAGAGSEFERCLSLARYLASRRLDGIRTVAFLPKSVKGHAVLPVIACEEIILDADAELGDAGSGETFIDATVRRGYSEIAERRRTIPVAMVLGMLDKDLVVYKAQTLNGVRFVLDSELDELKRTTTVSSVESIVAAGDMARFTGRELRLKYGFASHLANDRGELAAALHLSSTAIEEDPSLGGTWVPISVHIQGPINRQSVNWIERSIRERLDRRRVNFVCIRLDSPGGSANDSVRLAGFLAGLDPSMVRTVAFVRREARGDASIIALSCDHLVMADDAILGGPGAEEVRRGQMPELRRAVQAIAEQKYRDWSLPVALVDSEMTVRRYTREGTREVRFFSEQELATQNDPEVWEPGGAIDTHRGLSGQSAEEHRLARYLASGFDEFKQIYHLDDDLDVVQPNWAHMFVERLASPRFAGALLFVAWFALLLEFSQPGLSVAGFISALCFVLFFWSNFLHGTSGWLEVLLFLVGVASVLMEFFVIPGFGIFGLGGGILIIGSIVLASQTFVIPRNSYQMEQLPGSLMTVAAAGAGAFASLVIMRRYLPDAPVLKTLMLASPDEEQREDLSRREAMVDYLHLVGKRGRTTTQLTPSGKAQFGDEVVDVISDGEVIRAGVDVCVVNVRGSHVIVERIDTGGG
ncbi:MAG: nodulation protein NfeD [Pirellulaceae bacterium]